MQAGAAGGIPPVHRQGLPGARRGGIAAVPSILLPAEASRQPLHAPRASTSQHQPPTSTAAAAPSATAGGQTTATSAGQSCPEPPEPLSRYGQYTTSSRIVKEGPLAAGCCAPALRGPCPGYMGVPSPDSQ
jgi:hypothetical protein